MTDRELFEKALKEMSQREGLTPEERKRRCGELLVQAQYIDSKEYLRWMNDSTKRPWVGLTDDLYNELLFAVGNKYPNETRHQTALRYILQAEKGDEKGDEKAAHGIKGGA